MWQFYGGGIDLIYDIANGAGDSYDGQLHTSQYQRVFLIELHDNELNSANGFLQPARIRVVCWRWINSVRLAIHEPMDRF